jgi:hypothetical protein
MTKNTIRDKSPAFKISTVTNSYTDNYVHWGDTRDQSYTYEQTSKSQQRKLGELQEYTDIEKEIKLYDHRQADI